MNGQQLKGGCSGIHRDNVLEKFLDVQSKILRLNVIYNCDSYIWL